MNYQACCQTYMINVVTLSCLAVLYIVPHFLWLSYFAMSKAQIPLRDERVELCCSTRYTAKMHGLDRSSRVET